MEPVILKGRRVTRTESSSRRPTQSDAHEGASEVRSLTQGGVLKAIEVRCSCGDVVTIELDGSGHGPAKTREGGLK